jgi:hypothetical protein
VKNRSDNTASNKCFHLNNVIPPNVSLYRPNNSDYKPGMYMDGKLIKPEQLLKRMKKRSKLNPRENDKMMKRNKY